MATSKAFLQYVQNQCEGLPVRFRPMMGEYLLYYSERLAGGLYDNRLLLKDVPAARKLMPEACAEEPYAGAKAMLPVDRLDDKAFLAEIFEAVYPELPETKPRRRKQA